MDKNAPEAANAGFLYDGLLVARCVTPDSHGFTIATPTAQIVDLGTEFAVEVAQSGNVEVHVLEGKVESRLKLSGGGYGKPMPLAADQAIRIPSDGSRVAHIATTPERFAIASEPYPNA